jgi:choline monooxygenase
MNRTNIDIALLAPQPLDHATSLPARYYVAPATVALDRRAIFDRGWQILAHVCQLQNPGDHVVGDFSGLPVIAVRGADGEIRVFHNVCRHRAGPLASCDGLAAKSLRCRYHGWTYTLEGTLRSAPEMGTAPDFNVGDVKLPQLAVRVWQGLVFAAVDEANAIDFDAFVSGIDERLGANRHLERYGHHRRVGYDINCNWKIYVDNYLEGYHVPHVHPGLNRLLDYRNYVTETHDWYSLQWSPLVSADGSGGDNLYGSGDALYYWMWPNTMLNIVPGRLQTNRVIAKGADKCRVEFDFYYSMDESDEAATRRLADLNFSDEVQFEDLTICEDVQRGMASGSYQPGRLNPLRENAVHHFHEMLRKVYREASE